VSEVAAYLAALPVETRAALNALRAIVRAADPTLDESIKWNAPSFAKAGHDRITLGIERKGGVRAVVHRGSAPIKDNFQFDDPDRLAKWPNADRGVLTFADAAAVTARSDALRLLFTRWLAATAPEHAT
jgi:hypothetical protein